jgi:flagellar protein FlaI
MTMANDLKNGKTNASSPSFAEITPLREPHVYAAISKDPQTMSLKYLVMEPTLTDQEKSALKAIKEILFQVLDVDMRSLGSNDNAEKWLKEKIRGIIKDYKIDIEEGTVDKLEYFLIRDLISFGFIDPLMHDHMIEDISCDGPNIPVFVWHRRYESIPTNVLFEDENELDSFVVRLAYLAGKHISIANPMLDASLSDGSRIQLTYAREVTRKGSTFTIRRFRADPLTVVDLVDLNTMNYEMAAWFWFAIEKKSNILIAGGTASGKTTTLNSLSAFIPTNSKIVTIEDTAELNLSHDNWISSIARIGFGSSGAADITLFDLLKAAMRQRPDYVIVGEVRGDEAFTLFQAMATGHGGISSIHADSPTSAFNRLESEPMNIPRSLLTILDTVAMTSRVRVADRSTRRVTSIVEVVELDPVSREIILNEVFRWNPAKDTFEYSGRSVLVDRIMKELGLTKDYVSEELQRRKVLLEWMYLNKIRRFGDVGRVIRDYYADPEGVSEKIRLRMTV